MESDGKQRKRNEMIAPHVLQEDKFMKLEESLLPGISNAETLELIATKLPWRTFHTLSSVSPAWRQAIQDRLVSDARVLAHSGENFVIISDTKFELSYYHDIRRPSAVFLYSLINKTCHGLPPIPQVDSEFPYDCECIALDGKVYILGGSRKCYGKVCIFGESKTCRFHCPQLGSKDVYTLDLAGQRQWKPCARMQEARANFRCGVKDGKIYEFGGTSGKRWVLGSEVYDPSVDAWSAITPMGSWTFKCETNNVVPQLFFTILRRSCYLESAVATIGEELIVYHEKYNLRVYCPVTDKWRTLSEDFPLDQDHSVFTAHGKIHSMSINTIRVYDILKNEWTERHSWNSLAAVPRRLLKPGQISILAVLERWTKEGDEDTKVWKACPFLVQSKGFGSEDKYIVWEELPYPCFMHPSMCLLKL